MMVSPFPLNLTHVPNSISLSAAVKHVFTGEMEV